MATGLRTRKYQGLTVWFRNAARAKARSTGCLTDEAVEWLNSDRVAVHIDHERRLFALAPSTSPDDGKLRTHAGQTFIACTGLAHAFPEIIGRQFALKPANEPGIGRCLYAHVGAAPCGRPDPQPETHITARPSAKPANEALFKARQAIKALVFDAVQARHPVNADQARAIGRAAGLTSAEIDAAINRAVDEARRTTP